VRVNAIGEESGIPRRRNIVGLKMEGAITGKEVLSEDVVK